MMNDPDVGFWLLFLFALITEVIAMCYCMSYAMVYLFKAIVKRQRIELLVLFWALQIITFTVFYAEGIFWAILVQLVIMPLSIVILFFHKKKYLNSSIDDEKH
jgi:hypothetical protein